MSATTICIECKHDKPPSIKVFGGAHTCAIPERRDDFVRGGIKEVPCLCMIKNHGNCPDFEAKEA